MISVVVSTYNRPEGALRCLASLQDQADGCELLLVDNAADDGTRSAVEAFNASVPVPATYVPEPRLGLHNARHAGARAARGSLLLFTDDDVTAAAGWIPAYRDAFAEHETMVAAGGPVHPAWEAKPPPWLRELVNGKPLFGPLALMEPYPDFRLGKEGFFFGNNMAIRRDALFAVGGFSPELVGSITVGDGESGLIRKLRERGGKIGYVPAALVYHHVPRRRMTLDFLLDWQGHLAANDLYPRYAEGRRGRVRIAADVVAEAFPALVAGARALPARGRTDPRSVEVATRAAWRRARLRYVVSLLRDAEFRRLVHHSDWLNDPV